MTDNKTTIPEKQLKKLQEWNQQMTIASKRLLAMELEKSDLMHEVKSVKGSFDKMNKQLANKYGKDALINMQTGEVVRQPKTNG